jgi:hypothetical protein
MPGCPSARRYNSKVVKIPEGLSWWASVPGGAE